MEDAKCLGEGGGEATVLNLRHANRRRLVRSVRLTRPPCSRCIISMTLPTLLLPATPHPPPHSWLARCYSTSCTTPSFPNVGIGALLFFVCLHALCHFVLHSFACAPSPSSPFLRLSLFHNCARSFPFLFRLSPPPFCLIIFPALTLSFLRAQHLLP